MIYTVSVYDENGKPVSAAAREDANEALDVFQAKRAEHAEHALVQMTYSNLTPEGIEELERLAKERGIDGFTVKLG